MEIIFYGLSFMKVVPYTEDLWKRKKLDRLYLKYKENENDLYFKYIYLHVMKDSNNILNIEYIIIEQIPVDYLEFSHESQPFKANLDYFENKLIQVDPDKLNSFGNSYIARRPYCDEWFFCRKTDVYFKGLILSKEGIDIGWFGLAHQGEYPSCFISTIDFELIGEILKKYKEVQ